MSLVLCESLPAELVDAVWAMLPDRTRWTARKDTFEANYATLVNGIPKPDAYVRTLLRDSECSYVFGLLMASHARRYARLRAWTVTKGALRGVHTTYLSYLRAYARLHNNGECLALAADPPSRQAHPAKRPRGRRARSKSWTT